MKNKTKDELINELVELRQRIAEMEASETERKKAEELLRNAERDWCNLFNSLEDVMLIIDKDYNIENINEVGLRLLGKSKEEVIGKKCYQIISGADSPAEECPCKKSLETKQVESLDRYEKRFGRIFSIKSSPIFDENGEVMKFVDLRRDITERKTIEEEMVRLSNAMKISTDSIVISDLDAKIIDVNESTLKMYGTDDRRELIGKNSFDFIAPEDREKAFAHTQEVLEKGYIKNKKYHVVAKDGSRIPVEMSVALMKDANGKPAGFVGISRDITERKKMEEALRESEEKFRGIAEESFDVIYTVDPEERITYCSPAAERITGYKPAETIGKLFHEFLIESEIPKVARYLDRVRKGEVIENLELTIVKKSGRRTYIEMNVSPIIKDEHVAGFQGTFRDITYHKKAEEKIKASLKEKEMLLREIHHRVKNNLQIISSLLSLQSQQIQDKQTLEAFRESQNRIRSIALVHEQLYRSKGLARVNFAEYLQGLTVNLFDSYAVNREIISLKVSSPDILLGIDTATPCGLITHELASNCLKHAFPKGRKGEIHIDLRRDEKNQFTLIVKDNGIGFPKDLDFQNTDTLGLQLVNILVDQLDGSIELARREGTTFKITFGELRYKER